jgi:uncharacterized protein GlcG (DUF336 family)
VIYATVERLLYGTIRDVLAHLTEGCRAVDQDRALVLQPAESSMLHLRLQRCRVQSMLPCQSVLVIALALAARMTAAAIAEAAATGAKVSVAVVDAGGHLVHFQRMDGAEIAGPTLAVDKAYTAVAHRIDTAELGPMAAPGWDLAGLAANGGGRYVVFGGGLPVWSGDRVVAGIGVSGGTVAEDMRCARAALSLWETTTAAATPD